MTETITIKHNRAGLEAWHNKHPILSTMGPLLSGIAAPVVDYASRFDAVRVVYQRPSGPAGKTSNVTLYERNPRMNYLYRAGVFG